jgi:hypothetical protein
MENGNPPDVLSYKSPNVLAPRGRNWLALVAFVSALVFNPLLRLAVSRRPFWTGHPLHWIREIVDSIPVLVLPLPGVVLGVCALALGRLRGQRTDLAWAATLLGIGWYVLLAAIFCVFIFAWRMD